MNNFIFILSLFCILIFQRSYSQEKKIFATYTNETITLDGIDNEISWTKTEKISDEFYGIIPIPENKGSQKNEIKIIMFTTKVKKALDKHLEVLTFDFLIPCFISKS